MVKNKEPNHLTIFGRCKKYKLKMNPLNVSLVSLLEDFWHFSYTEKELS